MGISRRPKRFGAKKAKAPSDKQGFVLNVIDGQGEGREYFFERHAAIGRVEGNDIILVSPGVSRKHAQVYREHGIHLVDDLDSANGTRLNGEKIEAPEVLRDGDYITIAAATLQFSIIDVIKGEITAEKRLSGDAPHGIDVTGERRPKNRWLNLRGWRGRLLIGCFGLCLMAAAVWKLLPDKAINTIFDSSNVPVDYSDDDAFLNAVFGYGKWDQRHRSHVAINFVYLGGRVTLQYGAWGIDRVGEVQVLLNKKKVGVVPLTMKRWTYGLKLVLPEGLLRQGANELVFNNTRNPPHDDAWEVCYIQLFQEAIPEANPKEARHRFELAKKAWDDREIEPSNLYEALVMFKQARDYLEKAKPRPLLYQESLDYIDKIDKALTEKFDLALFSAIRAGRYNDLAKARTVIAQALRYFKKSDFRYRKLKDQLELYSEQQ